LLHSNRSVRWWDWLEVESGCFYHTESGADFS
jgi:hypothetical protein